MQSFLWQLSIKVNVFLVPNPQYKNGTKTGLVVGTKPDPQTTKTCSCLQNKSRRNTISMAENLFLQLILKPSPLFSSSPHKVMQLCARVSVFFLRAGMRRRRPATILSLCPVGKRSLAQLLSHSCSRHLSCHLDWPPRPVCWFSDFTVAYLLWGMSSAKLLRPVKQPESCFPKLY